MSMSTRDRRALLLWVVLVGCMLAYVYWPENRTAQVAPITDIPQAERRLSRVRLLAGAVPGREESLKKVSLDLAAREKGLIGGETANQAQARLAEIVRRVLRAQSPPIELRNLDLGQPKRLDSNYGEVTATFTFNCRIEQLVQFLADLSAQPELVAPNDLQMNSASVKEKIMTVRAAVSGLVPVRLVPERKGVAF